MKKAFLRTLKEFDMEEVGRHLLVVGDLKGDCFHCREIGLDYLNVKKCPQCGEEFHYISSRQSKAVNIKVASSLKNKRPDLIFIELNDFMFYKNKEKAFDLFS